ncbi:uncharacterized protein EDB91DRAFT_1267323 [Suillus paluster]|uniref:uncharacterized protein n=1 Tax=Suillus paluster TaxID=48578 RepID=UPI001B86BCB5|nr:uncharacterized protein EDB91DRAFT_1267323 [Suillus paluster]KAG1746707.1 hypothetical protein EDB91DRAFT_1267323 [Suillus paluster]
MASTGISLDAAVVASTVLEGILYGFSVLMFMGTIWASIHKHGIRAVNRPITVVAILLLILSTAHMVVDIIRLEDGLVKYRDTFPGGSVAFFEDINQKTYVIKYMIYALQTLLGDGVVIYRCYVVWRSVWVIILPSMLWCGVAVTGLTAVSLSLRATGDGNIYTNQAGQWITPFFSLTISTNLIGSGLLAYRIWTIERNVSAIRTTKGTMMPIVRVLVDAALIYSATLISTLICFINSSNGQYILLDMIMPIISIAFYMVLIRLAIRSTHNRTLIASGVTVSEPKRGTQYSMKPLQIHISQFTHSDDGTSESYGVANRDRTLTHKPETVEEAFCNV